MIGFKEQKLPTWFQQTVQQPKILTVGVVTKYGGSNDVIEALRRKLCCEIPGQNNFDVRQDFSVGRRVPIRR